MVESGAQQNAIAAHLAAVRPRVIAALARRFASLDMAEDAFQEACIRALETWSEQGLPKDPTAWLVATGRNLTIDRLRRDQRLVFHDCVPDGPDTLQDIAGDVAEAIDMAEMRDDVLRLMFMCCHTDLSLQDQLALALKVIGGFSVDEIARAFVVKPKAMEQRITRAKKKAGSIAVRLETPTLQERTARLDAVCAMVYLLFNEGYSASGGTVHIRVAFCQEAIRLARLLLNLFPEQAEVMGLLALCLFQHSRRTARIGDNGALVPLDEQDRRLWNRAEIHEGQVLLEKALRHGRAGSYQVQAAIAAAHCGAATSGQTDWEAIERLYDRLEQIQPSPIVSLNRAVALAKVHDANAGLVYLATLAGSLDNYLYFHATRGSLLLEAGFPDQARDAYRHALQLGPTRQEADHIHKQIALCLGANKI